MRSAPNGDLAGVRVLLNGAGDTNPPCRWQTNPICEGPWYTSRPPATRSARASTTTRWRSCSRSARTRSSPGHGVLIGKTKTGSSTCGSFSCFVWYIDANPQDINQVDYRARPTARRSRRRSATSARPTTARSTSASNSGSTYEFKAAGNNLHFYILDKRTDAEGVLRYTVGVRSLAGAGPQTRGVSLGTPSRGHRRGLRDLHVPAQEHGRGGGDAGRAPAGRVGVPRQRHLPPVGLDVRAPAGRRT